MSENMHVLVCVSVRVGGFREVNKTGNRMFHVLRADERDALGCVAQTCLSARDVRLHRFFVLVLASAYALPCSLATMLPLSVAFAFHLWGGS